MKAYVIDKTELRESFNKQVEVLNQLSKDTIFLSEISSFFYDVLHCIEHGGKLLLCGNGGFAAASQHISCELMGKFNKKRNPLPAISLSSDPTLITCIGNDFGFEKVFSRQIEGLGRAGDILIALSTSAKSKNILEAISSASSKNIKAYLFCGKSNYTVAKELGASIIPIPSDQTETIQDITMCVLHQLCRFIDNNIINNQHSIWDDVINFAKVAKYKTLILDRDGTINELIPNGYVLCASDLRLRKDFASHCEQLASIFENIIIVTNQACIGKGIISFSEIERINNVLIGMIEQYNGRIDKVYVCSDNESESVNRKPNIGVIDKISKDYPDIDFSKSIVVGDSYSDRLFSERIGSTYFEVQNI